MSANDKQVGGNHYKNGSGVNHWDFVEANRMGYLEGCASKYISRWRKKDGLKDLHKSRHYVEKLIEFYNTHFRMNRSMPVDIGSKYGVKMFCENQQLTELECDVVHILLYWYDTSALYLCLEKIDKLIEEAKSIEPNSGYTKQE